MKIEVIKLSQEFLDELDIKLYGSLENAKIEKEREAKLWCKCDNDEYGSRYINDNVSKVCDKHHWVCNKCNKITQIG